MAARSVTGRERQLISLIAFIPGFVEVVITSHRPGSEHQLVILPSFRANWAVSEVILAAGLAPEGEEHLNGEQELGDQQWTEQGIAH